MFSSTPHSSRGITLLPYSSEPKQYIWALSSAISASTSRYLLRDLGFHYPACLHLIQLHAALFMTILYKTLYRKELSNLSKPHSRNIKQLLHALLPSSLLALASILAVQAILHSPNLITSATLPILGLCVENIALCLATRIMASAFRVSSLGLCFAALLFGDTQLSVLILVYAIAAVLALGVARSLSFTSASTPCYLNTILSLVCGMVISCFWVLAKEFEAIEALSNLSTDDTIWLLANTVSSAIAITSGMSVLLPSSPTWQNTSILYPVLVMSGYEGCLSVVLSQRSYSSAAQMAAYVIAMCVFYTVGRSEDDQTRPNIANRSQDPIIITWPDSPEDDSNAGRSRLSYNSPCCTFDCNNIVSFIQKGIVVTSWLIFLVVNFAPDTQVSELAMLDSGYESGLGTEVVISMYNEPVETVASLITSLQKIPAMGDAQVHIYLKDATANQTFIREKTGAHRVSRLQNIGRESETYLHHILAHWKDLARHTLFVQAEAHSKEEMLWRIAKFFNPNVTGMLDLGFSGHIYRCDGHTTDQWGWRDKAGLLSRVYTSIHDESCSEVLLSYKGQFIVSGRRIRGIDKEVYKDLHETLVDPDGWAHQEPFLQNQLESMSAPQIGYTVERLWKVLFQCADTATAWSCPSYLGIGSFGPVRNNCQCPDI